MIDIETEVFSIISTKVRENHADIFITSEYVKSPPSFPCVSLLEADNAIYRSNENDLIAWRITQNFCMRQM